MSLTLQTELSKGKDDRMPLVRVCQVTLVTDHRNDLLVVVVVGLVQVSPSGVPGQPWTGLTVRIHSLQPPPDPGD